VSGGINEESSPEIVRFIIDEDRQSSHAVITLLILLKKLAEGLNPPYKPRIILRNQLPSSIASDIDRVAFMFCLGGYQGLAIDDVDIHEDGLRCISFAFEDGGEVEVDDAGDVLGEGGFDYVGYLAWGYYELKSGKLGLEGLRQGPEMLGVGGYLG
jgi:hypothetical protein